MFKSLTATIVLRHGLGLHIQDVSPTDLVTYLQVLYAGAPLYALTIVFIKLSLLVLYCRLFPVKNMIHSCLVVGTVVVAWALTTFIVGILVCDPIHKFWRPETHGQCLNIAEFYYGLQAPNIATDIIILILPMKTIYDLQLTRRKNMGLVSIFGLGLL